MPPLRDCWQSCLSPDGGGGRSLTLPIDRFRPLLLLCFVLSGATGLIYEVGWTRSLTLVFGKTTFAVSTVLAAFMAGLGAGAFLFGKLVDRTGRPLRTYALQELGIAASAFAFPLILPRLTPLYRAVWEGYHPSFLALSLLRFWLLFLLLLIPTMLMGGTLPALVRHFQRRGSGLGRQAGLLYGLNTLGAVLGAGVAGFAFLPWLGLWRTTTLAAALNLAIAAFALALSLAEPASLPAPASSPPRVESRPRAREVAITGAFALSGFVALLSEVAWTRGLTLVLGSSTYAFTIMLVTFLAGLAGGSLVMARLLARGAGPLRTLAFLQAGIGLASLAGGHLFANLPLLYLHLFKTTSGVSALLVAGQFALAGLVMLAPALLMGAVFPVVVQLLGDPGRGAGEQVGRAYAANTVGAVLGAFGGGFVLIPGIGIAGTLTLGIALSLFVALGVLLASGRHWREASATAAFLLGLPLLTPSWEALAMSSGVYKEAPLYLRLYPSARDVFSRLLPQFRLLYYREGPTATVTVTERPSLEDHRHLTLAIDGKVDASTAGDMPTQVLSGHLPLLLHPRPEKVLVIGLASGVTVGSVTRHPVRQVTAVEIEPAVVEASRLFDAFNHRPLDDPRVRLVVEDARNFLLLSPDRYDVIISEPSNPWMSGPAKLFTQEFFRLGRERLEPGGIFVQWLQLYGMTEPSLQSLLRTFQSVFPHLLVFQPNQGDLLLVGGLEPVKLLMPRIQERMRPRAVAADLERVRVRDVFDLLVRFRLGGAEVRTYAGEARLNTDDNALIEFSAPWEIHLDTMARNAETLEQLRRGVLRYLDGDWRSTGDRARFLYGLAERALESRNWRQGEVIAREAVASEVSAEGLWVLAEALMHQDREAEALRVWHEALALDPHHVGSLLSLARYHLGRGEAQAAQRYLASLRARSPRDPAVQFLLGVNAYRLGHYRRAPLFLAVAAEARRDGWPERASTAGRLAASSWRDGLGLEQLTPYYLHLVHAKLGDRRKEGEAWRWFLEGLDRWRRELERRPPDPAAFTPLDQLRLAGKRGMLLPEDAHLAEVVVRRVVEPLSRYYKGVTAYILGYPEVATGELEATLALLGDAGARSRARLYLGLAEWKRNRLGRARAHLEGFLACLEGPERQSLAAGEVSRALAAMDSAQANREGADEHERQAGTILRQPECP